MTTGRGRWSAQSVGSTFRRALQVVAAGLVATASTVFAQPPAGIAAGTLPDRWRSQTPPCMAIPDWEVHEYNPRLFVLRQSPCANYEKPFVYLLFGDQRALLLDTGAVKGTLAPALRRTVAQWLERHGRTSIPITVVHTHAHGDHVAGDAELLAMNDPAMPITLVPAQLEATTRLYGIRGWPEDVGQLDLGGRILDAIPIPGHQTVSVALYDRETAILFTGDSLYPGRLYVADWPAFQASTARLVRFTADRPVTHVLGNHVEQTRTPFVDYPVGTIFQPDERALALSRGALLELADALAARPGTPQRVFLRDFTIWPNASTTPDEAARAKAYIEAQRREMWTAGRKQ